MAALADDATPSSDELLERHEAQQLLARLVGELGEPYRSTILLRYAEGLEPTEIAHRQGVPAGTVRWRVKEGLARLRAELDEAHGGDRRAWLIGGLRVYPLAHDDGTHADDDVIGGRAVADQAPRQPAQPRRVRQERVRVAIHGVVAHHDPDMQRAARRWRHAAARASLRRHDTAAPGRRGRASHRSADRAGPRAGTRTYRRCSAATPPSAT